MTDPAVVVRAATLLVPLALSGWTVARLGPAPVDLFAIVWWGLAATSVVAVVLAREGAFSLGAIAAALGGVALVASAVGLLRGRAATEAPRAAVRRLRLTACAAGLAACAWPWPPFETFMAASDSTMYVDAGVHLARTGAYEVTDGVGPGLPADLRRSLFMSVGFLDRGPYVRLPGGLLKERRDAPTALPAFFPLLSSWTGILSAIGGASWAPIAAPLTIGLATWALALLAGEMLGAAAVLPTALVFLGNFAVWWFGRFAMSEPLTIAFVWGGLVFLGRGAPFAAGVMLGLGGVARAETLLFAIGALAWWALWSPVSRRELAAVVAGALGTGGIAAVGLVGSPNHHVAYLWNDLALARARFTLALLPALGDGRILCLLVLAPILPLSVAIAAAWRGWAPGRTTLRFFVACATVAMVALYLRIGGRMDTVRHLGWLASSLSPLGFALAVVGLGVGWRRGGRAGRLAVILVVLVALVFVPSPRVADYQPWSMRRYLPIVLPGAALFAGIVIGALWDSRRSAARVAAVVLATVTFAWQARPIVAKRQAPYFAGNLAAVGMIAERLPEDAVVVIDGGFAELQPQVALWLVYGRETVMATGGGPAWRALLAHLAKGARPAYWIQSRYAPAPRAPGLAFTSVAADVDLAIYLPDSPADTPPTAVIRKLVPLGIYGVTAGAGDAGTQSG
ncbi:MAG: hypothetical protein IT293_07165 [Deltaproteobacteria bacterium]|nr:hypothetical protein [Deltaproteobacteria bacterium]